MSTATKSELELFTRDPRKAKQFRSKKEAERGARAIGWSACDVIDADVMGFRLWVIADPHMRFVTPSAYDRWFTENPLNNLGSR